MEETKEGETERKRREETRKKIIEEERKEETQERKNNRSKEAGRRVGNLEERGRSSKVQDRSKKVGIRIFPQVNPGF